MREVAVACLASFAVGVAITHLAWKIVHNHSNEMWRRDWNRLAKQLARR